MEIKELYIKNFGKFADKQFILEDGIHIFYGENEYGKSTIFAFIKAMLFGLERARGRAAQNDEFSHYEPWHNPNYYAGTMRFTSGGKSFHLERCFDRYTKSASLICEDDGEVLSVADGDLEMLLGGMTRELFENTIAIGQLTARPGQGLAQELKNYAANLYETGSNRFDLNGALEALCLSRKNTDKEIKRLTEEQRSKAAVLYQRCQDVADDGEKLREELESNQKKLNSLQSKMDSESGRRAGIQTKTGISVLGIMCILTGAAGFVLGFAGVIRGWGTSDTDSWPSWILLCGGLVLCIAVGVIYFLNYKKGKRTEVDGDTRDCQKLEWENQRIQAEWKEKQVKYQNLQEQIEEMQIPTEKMKNLEEARQAALLAEEKLKESVQNMTRGFGDKLNEKASEILNKVTSGRYTRLLIEEQLTMTLLQDGRRISLERVSRGTMEQVYFAVRMAAVNILCQEQIPLILDEAFAYYDEKRLKACIEWLSQQRRQVIIFSCQGREQDLVKSLRGDVKATAPI